MQLRKNANKMSLVSILYVAFISFTVIIFYNIPKKFQWVWLLLSSILFFIFVSGINALLYVFVTILSVYIGAILIDKLKNEKHKKFVLITSLFIIIGELFILKKLIPIYAIDNPISNLFTISIGGQNISIAVPLGISYYTLSAAAYLIDVYRQMANVEKNFLKIALYTTYFPLITSGPIIRFNETKEELFQEKSYNFKNIKFGLQRIIWGFIKKTIIAERINSITSNIYLNYQDYTGINILILLFLYLFELYMNFSGCIDIVLGSSRFFGIKVPEEFNSPFFSKSVSEFFRRWHMTLGFWFKDYVFFPLMRSNLINNISFCLQRKNKFLSKEIPIYISLIILWMLLGLWHGLSYKFIFGTGSLPCFYMVLERLLNPLVKKMNIRENVYMNIFRCVRTYFLISFCTIFFISSSLSEGISIIQNLISRTFFHLTISLSDIDVSIFDVILIFISFVLTILFSFIHEKGYSVRSYLDKQNKFVQIFITVLGIIFVLTLGTIGNSQSEFIYKKF